MLSSRVPSLHSHASSRAAGFTRQPCPPPSSSSRRLTASSSLWAQEEGRSAPIPSALHHNNVSSGWPSCPPQLHRSRPATRLAAAGGDAGPSEQEDLPDAMTPERARSVLQVSPAASFDDILEQKQRQLSKAGGDQERMMEIEAAYDLLFMQSMKKRLSGELEVSTGVKYADVPGAPKRTLQQRMGQRGMGGKGGPQKPSWLPSLPTPGSGGSMARGRSGSSGNQGLGVEVAAPRDTSLAATQAAVFAGLGVWGIIQALLESPEIQMSETAGLQVALALGYATYTLTENKRIPLGKSLGLSLACLTLGALVGNGIEAWLRVDIVPVGNFSSPGVLVSEFIIAGLTAGAVFLV